VNNIGISVLASSIMFALTALHSFAAIAQQPPAENKGLKAVELRSNELSSEIDSVQGRKLRLRLLTLEPGGVVGLHSHKGRPTVLHVIKGTLVSHPQGKPEVILRPGDGLAEGKDSNHWVQNTGSEPAEFITVDVFK
jgi:quercetin dioxygenase-like cupin family protein